MERTDKAAVVPVRFGWTDLGVWSALREIEDRDDDVVGNAVFENARNRSQLWGSKISSWLRPATIPSKGTQRAPWYLGNWSAKSGRFGDVPQPVGQYYGDSIGDLADHQMGENDVLGLIGAIGTVIGDTVGLRQHAGGGNDTINTELRGNCHGRCADHA